MNSKMILSAAVAALLFSSCRKDNNSVPDTRAILGYQLKATNAPAGIQGDGAADATIKWTEGYAYPREMRFGVKADGSNYSEDHVTDYRTLDTARIDLFAAAPLKFGHIALQQEIYKEVELRIKLSPRSIYPAVQLKGTYTSSTVATPLPVTVQIFDACDIKTDVKDIAIDNNKANFIAATSIDLSSLCDGITENMISNAEIKDGSLLISTYTNRNLYDVIVGNLKGKRHMVQVGN